MAARHGVKLGDIGICTSSGRYEYQIHNQFPPENTEVWDNALSMHGCRDNAIHMIETASSVAGPCPSLSGFPVVSARSDNVDTARIGGRGDDAKGTGQPHLHVPVVTTILSILHLICTTFIMYSRDFRHASGVSAALLPCCEGALTCSNSKYAPLYLMNHSIMSWRHLG